MKIKVVLLFGMITSIVLTAWNPLPIVGGTNDDNSPEANAVVMLPGCTGTLVAPDLVLTAGHCISHRPPNSGFQPFNEFDWEEPGKWYPLYNGTVGVSFGNNSASFVASRNATHYNIAGFADIILLRLDSPIPGWIANPIKVLTMTPPSGAFSPTLFWYLQQFKMVGWGGGATIRQTADVRRGQFPCPAELNFSYTTPTKMCVTGLSRKSLQPGDSGGPLLWVDPATTQIFVVGVAQGVPGRYTVTFSRGGTDSLGRPRPNIGLWLEELLGGYSTSMSWDDQTPSGRNEAGDNFGSVFAVGNFFSDDFQLPDLAVGAPGEDLGSTRNAGAVYLFSNGGSGFVNSIFLTQDGVEINEPDDRFGAALAAGDFNNDNMPDLAVGAPGENLGRLEINTGMVFLFTGNGRGVGNPVLVRQDPADRHEAGDLFGSVLAVGDFDNNGYDDLAVGAPGEKIISSIPMTGAVFYYLGGAGGLGPPTMLTQAEADDNEAWDRFGSAMAVGDFNNDGFDDLAVGAPGESYRGSGINAGVVFVFFGSEVGLVNPLVFGQEMAEFNEQEDRFGTSLAVGDFNNDTFDDLAVGAPGENYLGSGPSAGAVFVFSGSSAGLGSPYVFGQEMADRNEAFDKFGNALMALDYNGDGFDDLAIGAPGENYRGSGRNAGVVFIRLFANASMGTKDFMTVFSQAIAGRVESGDRFGSAFAALKGSFSDDLLIGSPGEALGGGGANTGAFYYRP